MTTLAQQFETFMRESNWIEGERNKNAKPLIGDLHAMDIEAMQTMYEYAKFHTQPDSASLCMIHGMLSRDRTDMQYKGEWRKCEVSINGRPGCPAYLVAVHMEKFFDDWHKMNPWQMHAEYERIHPFEDLNGRTGRILWAWRMIELGQNPFKMPFLQYYYYQTLDNYK